MRFMLFRHFAHKVAQTWFVLHESWQTTLFSIYYCVEVVRIVNHNHMLEIYVLCMDFMRFKDFLALSRMM